jgi:flagellin-like protein
MMFKSTTSDATRGAVGIGTLIIFIAFVLVAAIAAVTVVDTADILQSTAQQTGSEATSQVSNQIVVNSVSGNVTGAETIDEVSINIMASAGADDIDMSQATIEFIGTNGQAVLTYDDLGPAAGDTFNIAAYKDDDASMPVINQRSDRAEVQMVFDGADAGAPLPEGDDVTVRIQTGSGSTSTVTFQVPETLDSKSGSIFLK